MPASPSVLAGVGGWRGGEEVFIVSGGGGDSGHGRCCFQWVSRALSDEGPSQQRLEGSMGRSQVETCGEPEQAACAKALKRA